MTLPRAMVFDVFGTVVDWRGSVAREGQALARAMKLASAEDNDLWLAFAEAWRKGYQPGMDPIRENRRAFVPIDIIHRERLEDILDDFGLGGLDEAQRSHLNEAWHRLDPWPDSVPGLRRLARRHILSPLSNGSALCLASMAKRAALPWDLVLSGDLAQQYKPRAEVYQLAIRCLGPEANQVMMVAAHNDDLRAARSLGMRTAFVCRPREWGPDQRDDLEPEEDWDFAVASMEELATVLGQ